VTAVESNPKPDPTTRPTWLLESRTSKEYKSVGLPYYEEPDHAKLTQFNIKCKGLYDREVQSIYRIRDVYDAEFLVWTEKRSFRSKLGNYDRITVQHLGKYQQPIPIQKTQFNDNEEQEIVAKGTAEILTKYEVPFTDENLDDLLLDANRHTTELFIKQDGRQTRRVDSIDEFRSMPFDELYTKVQTPKHMLPSSSSSTTNAKFVSTNSKK
jgi:hypothetical protein